jgi:hypothetical protein
MTQRILKRPSLNEQIEAAKTVGDVHALLAKGRSFQNFTNRTENRWVRTARRRIAELQSKNGATR